MISRLGFESSWFDKVFRKHLTNILGSQEDANIQDAQIMASWNDRKETELPRLNSELEKIREKVTIIRFHLRTEQDQEKLDRYAEDLRLLQTRFDDLQLEITSLNSGGSPTEVAKFVLNNLMEGGMTREEAQAIVRETDFNEIMEKSGLGRRKLNNRCGVNGCPGWLDEKWFCSVCKSTVCSFCLEGKKEGHTCKEEDIASADEIRKSSKPCPTCATLIYRISGCNHMFCTNCKNGFNWETLKPILKVELNNPHYNLQTAQHCDLNLSYEPYIRKLNESGLHKKRIIQFINNIIAQVMNHIDKVDIEKNPLHQVVKNNSEYNILFVRGKISKEERDRRLYLNQQHTEANQAFQFLFESVRDQLMYIVSDLVSTDDLSQRKISNSVRKMVELQKYGNEKLEELKRVYGRNSKYQFNFLQPEVVDAYSQ
jgi:hypothetical protein